MSVFVKHLRPSLRSLNSLGQEEGEGGGASEGGVGRVGFWADDGPCAACRH